MLKTFKKLSNHLTASAGHAGGSQRADLLPLPAGVLRRDDWLRQPRLPHRVVPLWVHEPGGQAQGQVVLPQVFAAIQEEEVKARKLSSAEPSIFQEDLQVILKLVFPKM